jgi:AAHS family 4-hydroxybenzoate transporter-like MFS transporter
MRERAGLTIAAAAAQPADDVQRPGAFDFFREGRAPGTVLLWVVFAINLAAFYLLQSWLPILLTRLHRDLAITAAATSLSTMGGIVAAFIVGPAMDRFGACRSLATAYGVGAVGVALLGAALPAAPWHLYLVTFCAGFCISGGQKSAIALAVLFYPASVRSTGLGWALGVGRAGGIGGPLLAGLLLGAGWSSVELFYAVAAGMLVAALATAAIGRQRSAGPPSGSGADSLGEFA